MGISSGGAPVALVTGAGSGIGRSVCTLLSGLGWRLALVGRRAEKLNGTGAALSTPWFAIPADVADPEQVKRAVDSASEHFGGLDALVNNAGYAPMTPIERVTPEVARAIYDINLLGPTIAIARAWPIFRQRGGGRIVNVSSYATVDPFNGLGVYAAAKAGVNLLAKSAANEGKMLNIRAFAVAPGAVETEMLRSIVPTTALPASKTLAPEAVASVIVECVTGKRDAQNGETILVPSPK